MLIVELPCILQMLPFQDWREPRPLCTLARVHSLSFPHTHLQPKLGAHSEHLALASALNTLRG